MPDLARSLARLGVVGAVNIEAPLGHWRLEGTGRSVRLDLLSLPRRDRFRALGWLARGLASGHQRDRLRHAQRWLRAAEIDLEITKGRRLLAAASAAGTSNGGSRWLGIENVQIRPANLIRALLT